jgi:hypothetical protein
MIEILRMFIKKCKLDSEKTKFRKDVDFIADYSFTYPSRLQGTLRI